MMHAAPASRIETERLRMRRPRRDDVDAYLRIVSDQETMRFLGGVRDRARVTESIERWLDRWDVEGFGHFLVDCRANGTLMGQIGLTVWDGRTWKPSSGAEAGDHVHVEIGWMLAREHWGRGYAVEAARAVRDWAYSVGISSIVSIMHPDNAQSATVAAKLGAWPAGSIVSDGDEAAIWVHPSPSATAL